MYPQPNWDIVFECKYEIDSLASFLTLTNEYIENSGDFLVISKPWLAAYSTILNTINEQTIPSFEPKIGLPMPPKYSFKRNTNIGSETLPLGGVGNPVNFGTGLVRSAFRPSDDATVMQFFIPGNMQMHAALLKLKSRVLEPLGLNSVLDTTSKIIENIAAGIEKFGKVDHPIYGKVFAYEVDGYGGQVFMDDANIPSLLSIPDFGFTTVDDPVYQNTRRMILEKRGNPYFIIGQDFEGIGGPHIGVQNAWPMSLLLRIRTSNKDEEIVHMLHQIMETTGGFGLMHELIDVSVQGGDQYTRSWFAWCNSEFGKTILWLAKYKPHLIFKPEYGGKPYDIDAVLNAV